MVDASWAIADDLQSFITERFAKHRYTDVVEFGSGLSTKLFADLKPAWGIVTAYEQSPEYAAQTRELVGGVPGVTVVEAPIVDGWYGSVRMPDIIDFVLVDGPGPCENRTREPAMDAVYGSLVPGAMIVVDDANREEARVAMSHWVMKYKDLYVRHLNHERGTYVLVKHP